MVKMFPLSRDSVLPPTCSASTCSIAAISQMEAVRFSKPVEQTTLYDVRTPNTTFTWLISPLTEKLE